MNYKKLNIIFKKIKMENINQGINIFNKAVQDFGKSMDSITSEMSADIKKLNKESEIREKKNKENLDKIWGKRDWGVKSAKFHTRILVDINYGKSNKYADSVVTFVTISHGMEAICMNTGVREIDLS